MQENGTLHATESKSSTQVANNRSSGKANPATGTRRQRSQSLNSTKRSSTPQNVTTRRSPSQEGTREKRRGSNTDIVNMEFEDFMLPQYLGNMYGSNGLSKVGVNASDQKQQKDGENQTHTSDSTNRMHHIHFLPHGFLLTLMATVLSWVGLGLAVLSRVSLNFVRLETPWHIAALYEDVSSLGIIHAGICYNETMTTIRDPSKVGCFKLPLASNDALDDPILSVSAAFASVSVALGFMLCLSITASFCWQTINLKATGAGYLFLYCFQSLSFLFFDSDLCEVYQCKVGTGCLYCIGASLSWIITFLVCGKMESNRSRREFAQERRRRKKKAAKEAVKQQSIVRRSEGTIMTERLSSTLSTFSDEQTFDLDEEYASPPEKPRRYSSSSGIARQHESIITLGPSSSHCAGYSSTSSIGSFSMDDTLDHRTRGRLEYQGKVVGNRGRGRSRPKKSSREGAVRRSSSRTSREGDMRRSSSRTKERSASARRRSTSRPRHTSMNYKDQNLPHAKKAATKVQPMVDAPRKATLTKTQSAGAQISNGKLLPRDDGPGYVTSYYDI